LKTSSHKKGNKKDFKRKDKSTYAKGSSWNRRDISQILCFRCHKYGHYAIKCFDRTKQQASFVEVGKASIENDSEKLVFYSALSSQVSNKLNTSVIDSGSSRHIIEFKEHLDTLVENYDEEVTIGDDSNYPIKRIGTCTKNLKSTISLQLTGVLFVPRIKRNLVSISTLEDKEYRITFMEAKFLAWPKNSTINH
jgi:hypothetical protein